MKNKLRFIILFLMFTLSIMITMSTFFFYNAAIEASYNGLNKSSFNQPIIISNLDERDQYFNFNDVSQKISNIDGIKYISPKIYNTMMFKGKNIDTFGIDYLLQEKIYPFEFIDKEDISISNFVILNEKFAKENSKKINDKISFSVDDTEREKEFIVKGIIKNDDFILDRDVYIEIKTAQEIFNQKENVTSARITIENLSEIDKIVEKIKNSLDTNKYQIDQSFNTESIKQSLDTVDIALKIFGFLSFLITIFITGSIIKTMVFERLMEIGTMKSLGVNKFQLVMQIFVENLIVSISAYFVSLFLTFPFVKFLITMFTHENVEKIPKVDTKIFVIVFFVVILITLLNSFLSLQKILKMSSISIIKGNFKITQLKDKRVNYIVGILGIFVSLIIYLKIENLNIILIGTVIFFISFILIIPLLSLIINIVLLQTLGRINASLRLILIEMKKDFLRNVETITLVTLVLSVMFISVNMSSLLKQSVADIYGGIDVRLYNYGNTDLMEELQNDSHNNLVIKQVRSNKKSENINIILSGINGEEYKKMSFEKSADGNLDKALESLNLDKNVIVSSTFAKNSKKSVGDYIYIEKSLENKKIKYKITCIVNTFEEMGKVLFISDENFKKDFKVDSTLYFIKFNKEKKEEGLKNLENKYKTNSDISINSLKDARKQNEESNASILIVINVLFIITCLLGIININNNFIISIIKRKKSFAIKRTLGMRKSNIRNSLILESVVIGTTSGCLGIISGIILNKFVLNILSYFVGDIIGSSNFSYTLILLAVSITVCVLSSILPSIRVNKSNLVEMVKNAQ